MKRTAALRSALLAGIAAGALVAAAGRLLGWTFAGGELFLTGALSGSAAAVVCAGLFEFASPWAGVPGGVVIGLLLGTLGAALSGLMPWLASYYELIYLPAAAPLGPHDPSWPILVVVAAGAIAGGIAGASYGTPRRAQRRHPRTEFREVFRRSG